MPEVAPITTIVRGAGGGESALMAAAQLLADSTLLSPMTPLSIRSRVLSGSRDSTPTSRVSGPTVYRALGFFAASTLTIASARMSGEDRFILDIAVPTASNCLE